MAERTLPPREIAETWLEPLVIERSAIRLTMECDLAWVAQYLHDFDPSDPASWEYLGGKNSGWFGYLSTDMDWNERRRAFDGETGFIVEYANYLRQTREYLEDPNARVEELADNVLSESIRELPREIRNLQRYREGTALIGELVILGSVEAAALSRENLAERYPSHELLIEIAAVTVRRKYTCELLNDCPIEPANRDEYYEYYQPVTVSSHRE